MKPSDFSIYQGLIFDIDGTLVDTMPTHYKASNLACNPYGFDFPYQYFLDKAGIPTHRVFKMLIEELGIQGVDPFELANKKEEHYIQLIHEIKPNTPVSDIANYYLGTKPMSLGTGGTKEIAHKTLTASGFNDRFDIIVTCDDVEHPKPAPDTFLECAKRMGISPEACIVFEDADLGIQAAHAAGMHAFDVRTWQLVLR